MFPSFQTPRNFFDFSFSCPELFPIVAPLTEILLFKRDLAKSAVFLPAWLSTSLSDGLSHALRTIVTQPARVKGEKVQHPRQIEPFIKEPSNEGKPLSV